MKSLAVDWTRYRRVIERMSVEDGGGFRIYYKDLGFAVYGVGDTLDDALSSFKDAHGAFESFMLDTPNYVLPEPSNDEPPVSLQRCFHTLSTSGWRSSGEPVACALNNYSYAA